MSPLKVVCLISGGKDSLFSSLHCLQNGHEIVALANLHPPTRGEQDAEDDLDSYMYQTVGHKIIPLYEQALGLPLYRQEITGSAVNQNKSYGQAGEDEDETEDLLPLLRRVQQHHPNANAVSTGAILSDYQRTRVESIAIRLGLVPLSYLWQWPNLPPHTQTTLLEDMHTAGQDSRIIKVASGGLDTSFLWCNVADMRTVRRIDKAVKRFGSDADGAVLGEGGEYETLAVAGPAPLWKRCIAVDDNGVETVAGEAGSASVRINGAQVVQRDTNHSFDGVRTPPLLESMFEAIKRDVLDPDGQAPVFPEADNNTSGLTQGHVCLETLTGTEGESAAQQMATILDEAIPLALKSHSPPLAILDVAYVSIILRNMADFAAVNAIYTKAFTAPNPPARITLAEPSVLPAGKDVMVSVTCSKKSASLRRGLHVQSQSYWAPANIGPYSQAISIPISDTVGTACPQVVFAAGQIPLVPASMELAFPEAASGDRNAFADQAVLAAQHFVRIGRAMQVRAWACGIAFIAAVSDEDAAMKATLARQVWSGLHRSMANAHSDVEGDDEDEDFDIWNVTHGAQRDPKHGGDAAHQQQQNTGQAPGECPALRVIRVNALPRGASIEWATYGLTATGSVLPHIAHFHHLLDVFKETQIA